MSPFRKIPPHEDANPYIRSRLIHAIDKFNAGDFFECHEILEDIWFDVRGSSRDFYQGLLHIAVGFYHLTKRKNKKGTILQLNKALTKLEGYGERFNGVDTDKLLKQVKSIAGKLKKNETPKRLPKITIQ